MRRVYPKGEYPKGVLIFCDARPVELSDGRVVLLSGREWFANATDERRLECARAIAYDEERHAYFHARPGGLKCLCGSPSCPNPAGENDP